jgi:polar amino acid transport system substrate-binding protein
MNKKYFCFLFLLLFTGVAIGQSDATWRVGWFNWAPYQELANPGEWQEGVDGLDIELIQVLGQKVGAKTRFYQWPWHDQIEKIKKGEQDVGLGATKTPEREAFAFFSKPYRYEQISLFVRVHNENAPTGFKSTEGFIAFLKASPFRLGVIQGMAYPNTALNAFLSDPKNVDRIVWAHKDSDQLINLKEGKIDGLLTDRLSASMALWETGRGRFVEEVSWDFKTPIHLMFSKKAVSSDTLKAVNQTIDELLDEGALKKIIAHHLFLAPLNESLHQSWFIALDLIGVLAFAISGALIAWRLSPSLWVFTLLVVAPALGSPLLRDVILGRPRLTLYTQPLLIYSCACVLGFAWLLNRMSFFQLLKSQLLKRSKHQYTFVIQVFDAVGLGVFTVTSVLICAAQSWSPLWFSGALVAMIASSGLIYLREHLWKAGYPVRDQFFMENAALWSVLFALTLGMNNEGIVSGLFFNAILLTLLGAIVTRILAIYFGWKGLHAVIPSLRK